MPRAVAARKPTVGRGALVVVAGGKSIGCTLHGEATRDVFRRSRDEAVCGVFSSFSSSRKNGLMRPNPFQSIDRVEFWKRAVTSW